MIVNFERFFKELGKLNNKLKSYEKFIEKSRVEDSYKRARMLSEIENLIKNPIVYDTLKASPLFVELEKFLTQEKEKITHDQEELHFNIGIKLSNLLSEFGELKGQLPNLRIKYYTLKFNFNEGTVGFWWGPEKELIKKLPLNLDTIVKTVKEFDRDLQSRWHSYKEFCEVLKTAYRRYLVLNNLSWGDKVNLLELLREIVMLVQKKNFWINPTKNNFREYSRVTYSYDLYQLKTTQELINEFQLTVATFALTDSKATAIWVPDNESGNGTYYSTIAFQK
ncbi:MAG: hypothetical protein NZ601_01920 [candidate division WOR-3 bacterium]|nr:hypothetical protein [candidate division WOR-3 bacterium]MCX7757589.1 hypothetical protein [candidate division WOR-3 bacterium]MDW7987612.1 hypothetical protein [candidate division WOR-3 bacterium]